MVEVGNEPKGVVVDPASGLVAVGLRDPDLLALVDSTSGEVVRNVRLPESSRHLQLVAPGGPVLVPAKGSDTLLRFGLPQGDTKAEATTGSNPHGAAVVSDGRIFVGNESSDETASVTEDERIEPRRSRRPREAWTLRMTVSSA